MPDAVLKRYAERCYQLATQDPIDGQYPEWVLQKLDQDWITEFPSPAEANVYVANAFYVKSLLSKLGSTEGIALEQLAEYVMFMPGCKLPDKKKYVDRLRYRVLNRRV